MSCEHFTIIVNSLQTTASCVAIYVDTDYKRGYYSVYNSWPGNEAIIYSVYY